MGEPFSSKPYDIVTEIDRAELFRVLYFLDNKLPDYAEVHSMVLSLLSSTNPSHCLCFVRQSENENVSHLTMTCVKPELKTESIQRPKNEFGNEKILFPNKQSAKKFRRKHWNFTALNIEFALNVKYTILEHINWETDATIVSYASYVIESE